MRTLNLKDPNPFYAPASDECWVRLAQAIMEMYSVKYIHQLPTTAVTQGEYDYLNAKTYAPIRRSILRNIKNGPLRNSVDIHAVYAGLEQRRMENKQSLGIRWEEHNKNDLEDVG